MVADLAGETGGIDVVLVDDRNTDHSHCPTRDTAMVWRDCGSAAEPALFQAVGAFQCSTKERV